MTQRDWSALREGGMLPYTERSLEKTFTTPKTGVMANSQDNAVVS